MDSLNNTSDHPVLHIHMASTGTDPEDLKGGWLDTVAKVLPPKSAMAAYAAYLGVSRGMLPQNSFEI